MTPEQARNLDVDLQFCLHIRCGCGRSTVLPMGLIKDKVGTLGGFASKLRCSACGQAPAHVYLSESMIGPDCSGGPVGIERAVWVDLVG